MLDSLFALLETKKDEMVAHRRWLHAHPELSFEEKETSDYIFNHYQGKDVHVERFTNCYGIKVTIDSGQPRCSRD